MGLGLASKESYKKTKIRLGSHGRAAPGLCPPGLYTDHVAGGLGLPGPCTWEGQGWVRLGHMSNLCSFEAVSWTDFILPVLTLCELTAGGGVGKGRTESSKRAGSSFGLFSNFP